MRGPSSINKYIGASLLPILSIGLILLPLTIYSAFVSADQAEYVPGEIIIKLKENLSEQKGFAFMGKAHSQKGMSLKQSWKGLRMHHFKLRPGDRVEDMIESLQNEPEVEYAEPNFILKKSSDVGILQTLSAQDISSLHQSGVNLSTDADVGVEEFWQSKTVGALSANRPIVAVIDTGLDMNHPVFVDTNAVWKNPGEIPNNGIDDDGNGYVDDVTGWNFVDNSRIMYDDDGHGTHVAGIILNVDQDIFDPPLQESRIQIMPLKFLDGNGSGTTSNGIKAIYYAMQNGAVVLNNSWGGPNFSAALHEAIAASYNYGVSFVASAGNNAGNNDQAPMYPASYTVPNVLSIAASTSANNLASFSNFGASSVGVASPGVYILSTLPGGMYGTSSGTSMAAPLVSGIAAQMKVESPNMLGYQIKSIIFSQSQVYSQLSGKVYTSGRVHASNSIEYSKTATVEGSQPNYVTSFGSDRELASTIAQGGCGTVAKHILDGKGPMGRGSPAPQTWYILLVMGLIALPMLVASILKSQRPESRRRHERFKIDSDVRVRVGDRELIGSISTISLGGAQLNTDALLENGGIVTMMIAGPDGREQVQVQGQIVWSESQKAYGVAFKDATYSTLDQISAWTKRLQKAS